MKNIITITILILTILFTTACDDLNPIHKDHQSITIEMDGDVTYILKEDASDVEQERLLSQFIYRKTSNIVDNNVYNFIVSFPIKSKNNLYDFIRIGGFVGSIYISTLDRKRAIYPVSEDIHNTVKDNDEYYHYLINIESNRFASEFFLNDIGDIKIHWRHTVSNFTDDIEYSTNDLIIPKEQLINLLDSLAIPHDRLEFQTD